MVFNSTIGEALTKRIRITWHWFTMGPYHFTRMAAIANQPSVDLTVIETTSKDDHAWFRESTELPFRLVSLSDHPKSGDAHRRTSAAYGRALISSSPDILIESGYAEPFSRREAIRYRLSYPRSRLILWSESTAIDHPRVWHREAVKQVLLSAFDGALAAGPPHEKYLRALGMPEDRIAVVGNCVDNDFFRLRADIARQTGRGGLPDRYFLFVGRLIPVKNIAFLLDSYSQYRQRSCDAPADLVLVGSGLLEGELRSKVQREGIDGVHFVGNKQLDDLPKYYAHAISLILPSTSEPWGLVTNEALASGTPVLLSNRCGCIDTLLVDGQSGFTFDPHDRAQLASLLERMARTSMPISVARNTVSSCDPQAYAKLVTEHIRKIATSPGREANFSTRCALNLTSAIDEVRSRIAGT